MSPTPKAPKRPANAPLPKPNVEFATVTDAGDMTPNKVRGMIANPVYAGVGPYPAIIEEEKWIRSAARMIQDEGAEQFLANMLYVLRQSLGSNAPESNEE